jgi:hypothetical protein
MTDDIMQWAGPSAPPDAKELADRYAIAQLVRIYALGVDSRSFDLCRSAFSDDAFGDGPVGKVEINEYLRRTVDGSGVYHAAQHNITNQFITLKGDEAFMVSYGITYHMEEPGNGRQNLIIGVQYSDRCRRFPKGWLIVHRASKLLWVDGPLPRK